MEKASAREAAADARREEIQRGARIARLEREQIVQARAKEAERAATAKIEEQEERTRYPCRIYALLLFPIPRYSRDDDDHLRQISLDPLG